MIKIDKLFGDKKGNTVIYILLAMGIMLLIAGNSVKKAPVQTVSVPKDSRAAEAERILSEIKGVGQVRVMISQPEKDEGAFSVDKKTEKESCSVLIVADGGDDSRICEKIVRAAGAALGVDAHKIQVFERKDLQ